jgi:hypothetical protein
LTAICIGSYHTFLQTQSCTLFLLLLKQAFWPISALTVEHWVFLLALAPSCPVFTPSNASCFLDTVRDVTMTEHNIEQGQNVATLQVGYLHVLQINKVQKARTASRMAC